MSLLNHSAKTETFLISPSMTQLTLVYREALGMTMNWLPIVRLLEALNLTFTKQNYSLSVMKRCTICSYFFCVLFTDSRA